MSTRDRAIAAAVHKAEVADEEDKLRVAADKAIEYYINDTAQVNDWMRAQLGDALLLLIAARPKSPFVGKFLDDPKVKEFLLEYVKDKPHG